MSSFAAEQRDLWLKRFGRRMRLRAPDDRGVLRRLHAAEERWPGSSLPGGATRLLEQHAKLGTRKFAPEDVVYTVPFVLVMLPMLYLYEASSFIDETEFWSLEGITLHLGFMAAFGLAVGALSHLLLPLIARSRYPQTLKECDRLVAFGICPCCGQMFDREPPDADGIIGGPACGAGWKADRLQPALVAALHRVMRDPGCMRVRVFEPSTWVKYEPLGTKDLVDDRRMACTLRFLRTVPAWVEDPDGELQQRLERIYTSHIDSGKDSRAFLAVVAFVASAIAIGLVARMVLKDDAALVLIGLAVLILVVPTVIGLLILRTRQGADWFEFKHTSLMERLCPVCTSSLDHLAPDDDGCTVCPACKAAWDMSRSQRSEA